MKHLFLSTLAIMTVVLFSCKDKEVDEDPEPNRPQPKLELNMGVFDNGTFSVKPFSSTDVKYDSIKGFDRMGVSLEEANLPYDENLEFEDLMFEFTVNSMLDSENFVDGQNANNSYRGLSSFGDRMYIDAEFYFPIKVGAPPVLGNDTLEIAANSDALSFSYVSKHSTLSDTVNYTITP